MILPISVSRLFLPIVILKMEGMKRESERRGLVNPGLVRVRNVHTPFQTPSPQDLPGERG